MTPLASVLRSGWRRRRVRAVLLLRLRARRWRRWVRLWGGLFLFLGPMVVLFVALGVRLLDVATVPPPVGSLPASNPKPTTISMGHCTLWREINGAAWICPISGTLTTFPPMFAAPIAPAVVSNTAGNPPGGMGGAL